MMKTKTALRGELYAAILTVIKLELPGIRSDLHRRISKRLAEKIADRIHAVYEENARLAKTEQSLTERLGKPAPHLAGISEITRAITVLENAKRKIENVR